MKAWTDYPITELGDIPHKKAPIRQVTVLYYDGDKYCKVLVGGVTKEIKSGYLYKEMGRLLEVEPVELHKLPLDLT